MKALKCIILLGVMVVSAASAQGNLEVNTPAIGQVRASMQARHAQLAPHYASGAVGLGADGSVVLRDANAVPLAQRQAVQGLVAQENSDRAALYREIARANGHPEWEADIRAVFAQRWIERAQAGWYIQSAGQWARK
ncbi:YdbL family protein [Methyloversatilis sp.]|uniref:YdbL family protein n=1 Tax=Methyloversatilis sp. TaxID=2569862 RepID=UPI0035B345E2